ncbi:MAG TPA: 50S ribosomal protein L6 [candidate division WWE3 bacterium]|uniref:50S ribosomal protein L6 n=1 Tax=candidate division WWE3 bacterium TaxID=2053526 RepID=A0A7C1DPQ1_UNCKA|nr:50S ribosomal protein L6 [candidate division WWE3 bacterium]
MSRIGKLPIEVPANVTVELLDKLAKIKGPKGVMEVPIRPEVSLNLADGVLTVKLENPIAGAYWGLTRSLLANAISGVCEEFEKDLELSGVGYRVTKEGNDLSLTLGFSHAIKVVAPEGIEFIVSDNQNIKVKGVNKQLVGLTASKIRKLRKPEPYLGKGIKYKDEIIRRKAGKSAV